jgi:outer membrane protein OmpA-like peptidoglycan-associated protein/flagellar hook assembly protein FlgD
MLSFALIGCQTAKPGLITPAESAIQVEASGFSPSGPAGHTTIEISLLFGNGESIQTWKVEAMSSGVARKTWKGDPSYLPSNLTWDGTTDGGSAAPEGTYTARLSIEYAGKYQPVSLESRGFVLDVSPPSVALSVVPPALTPTPTGVSGPVTFAIDARSAVARLDSWSIDVLDASGSLVRNWTGTWPNATATWDGTDMNGGSVKPSTTYTAVASVKDEYGNSAQMKAAVAVAALRTSPGVAAQPAPAPVPAGQPFVRPSAAGFSPNGDQVADTIGLTLGFGEPGSVKAWTLTVSSPQAGTEKTWSGTASSLPDSVAWDGKSDSGAIAPEGQYTAALSVDYGNAHPAATATSSPFVLDVTPPTGSIALSAPLFSPIESSDTISLKITAQSPTAGIDSWAMDIYDPGGNVFRTMTGKWPSDTVVWNGRNAAGELVQSAEDYPVVVKIRDQFGNVGTVKSVVPVDILVEKTATGYRIIASRIFFKAFTADYRDVSADLASQNGGRLDALAAKLKKFAGYKIRIVGHAVMINWDKPVAGREEQEKILIPLSKARADAVKSALVERGLDAARFTTDGVGAADQLVPDSNYKDRWENRRVALFLEKE